MTELIDRTISLAGLTFHYREAGDPMAPPLILLHALGLDAHDWDDVALMLAEHNHVFALDQRGHGESARPDIYSFETMRDDLKAFADALSLDRFTLIGHSMGGTVAFLFAEKWPERVERLIIEDTCPPYGGVALSDPPDESPGPVPFDWQMLKALIRQLGAPDNAWWDDLPRISAPTLIIGGGSTSHIPQEKLADAAHLIPDCQLVIIEGAGHAVHQNRASEYNDLLQKFLFAASRGVCIETNYSLFQFMLAFTDCPTIPSQFPFCQVLTSFSQCLYCSCQKETARAAFEIVGRLDKEVKEFLHQFHLCASQSVWLQSITSGALSFDTLHQLFQNVYNHLKRHFFTTRSLALYSEKGAKEREVKHAYHSTRHVYRCFARAVFRSVAQR